VGFNGREEASETGKREREREREEEGEAMAACGRGSGHWTVGERRPGGRWTWARTSWAVLFAVQFHDLTERAYVMAQTVQEGPLSKFSHRTTHGSKRSI